MSASDNMYKPTDSSQQTADSSGVRQLNSDCRSKEQWWQIIVMLSSRLFWSPIGQRERQMCQLTHFKSQQVAHDARAIGSWCTTQFPRSSHPKGSIKASLSLRGLTLNQEVKGSSISVVMVPSWAPTQKKISLPVVLQLAADSWVCKRADL